MNNNFIPSSWDPECVLYKRHGKGSTRWYVRIKCYVGRARYLRKSLGTSEISEAFIIARRIYNELRIEEQKGLTLYNRDFIKVFQLFINDRKDKGISNHRLIRIDQASIDLCHFFQGIDASHIDNNLWVQYLNWRCSEERVLFRQNRIKAIGLKSYNRSHAIKITPSKSTLDSERQVLIQVLRFAKSNNYIGNLPLLTKTYTDATKNYFPGRISSKALDKESYRSIRESLKHYCFTHNTIDKNSKHYNKYPRSRYSKLRLYYFVYLLSGSLIRIQESKHIKWNNIEIKLDNDGREYGLIFCPKAKVKISNDHDGRWAILKTNNVKFLHEWKRILKKLNFFSEDGYLFPAYMTTKDIKSTSYIPKPLDMTLVGREFSRFLNHPNVNRTRDARGLSITLNSFVRHTPITNTLLEDKFTIPEVALLANNSIQAISTNYYDAILKEKAVDLAHRVPPHILNSVIPKPNHERARVVVGGSEPRKTKDDKEKATKAIQSPNVAPIHDSWIDVLDWT